MGVTFLLMNWTDSESFVIPQGDLCRCVEFIHDALTSGSSVLVHCAQVSTDICLHVLSMSPLTIQSRHLHYHEWLWLVVRTSVVCDLETPLLLQLKMCKLSLAATLSLWKHMCLPLSPVMHTLVLCARVPSLGYIFLPGATLVLWTLHHYNL